MDAERMAAPFRVYLRPCDPGNCHDVFQVPPGRLPGDRPETRRTFRKRLAYFRNQGRGSGFARKEAHHRHMFLGGKHRLEPKEDLGRGTLYVKPGREADASHNGNPSSQCAGSQLGNMQTTLKLLSHFVI